MLLRSPISTTKKFFQKSVQTFKSFLSSGYQKLPKSSPSSPFHNEPHYKELERFYTDFTSQWDDDEKTKCKKRSKKRSPADQVKWDRRRTNNTGQGQARFDLIVDDETKGDKKGSTTQSNINNPMNGDDDKKRKKIVYNGKKYEEFSRSNNNNNGLREEKSYVVAQKLKELKMIDNSNEEHVLDVDEILHYYSRLTCPVYLDIVDKFFMEMYSELFTINQSSSSHHHHHAYNSRSDLRSFSELY